MTNIKSTLTDWIAGILAVLGAVQVYLGTIPDGSEMDWLQLAFIVVGAILSFFTGRNGDGSKKKVPSKV